MKRSVYVCNLSKPPEEGGTGGMNKIRLYLPSLTLVEIFNIINYEWNKNCILISQYVTLKIGRRYHHEDV